ncbi:phage tail protein [Streptomyces sp. NPDC086091]|uniref:phage tail protein n=1 Tax=Streptomyces sp. NPDC086091 TaxID=3365751 RepID=UPI003823BF6F
MRAAVEGLGSPYSLADLLPGVFREDPFTVRLTAGWDEVVAPVVSTLDCLDAYVDPRLTPPDVLAWLAERLGTPLDENWPLTRRRAATEGALTAHRTGGTVEGVRRQLALATGGTVELVDSGGVFTSQTPGTAFPADLPETAVLRLTMTGHTADTGDAEDTGDDGPGAVDLEALTRQCMPAHVPYRTEVIRR